MEALLAWLTAHPTALPLGSAFVVGLLDLLFALKPSWAADGILHWIYLQAKNLATKSAEVPKV